VAIIEVRYRTGRIDKREIAWNQCCSLIILNDYSPPLRMMLRLSSPDERIVAVLHDVVEDCPGWIFDRLRDEGFSDEVIAALDSVTKREGEKYEDFVKRAAANPIGRNVKLADLADNCDLSRIAEPTEADYQRIEKYQRAIKLIHSI